MIKKTIIFLGIALLALVAIVLFNTFTNSSIQTRVEAVPAPEIRPEALHHFQQALAYKTISYGDSTLFDSAQFNGFRKFLERSYPRMHQVLSREIVATYSLLYKWEGRNNSLKPVVLMAHQDVVPIEPGTESMWQADPFAGTIKDNFIWGRGTTDDKINLISICEAIEKLTTDNFQPERTIYLAFGHDEEIGGKGAIAIARLLKERNIVAEMVMDEGGIITLDKIPGLAKPVALLGTSEKGYLSLNLSVEKPGGHSSMPEKETSIDILAEALVKLHHAPFEARFSQPMKDFMKSLGPEMPFVQRMAFSNPWLFKKLITRTYEKSGPGNAMIRTTIAPTILTAGVKDNVVPTQAKATVNFRLLPGDESAVVIAYVQKIINDERVKVSVYEGAFAEASAVTATTSLAYQLVETTIKKSYPKLLTSPFLMIGATDSRHFGEVSTNIIKFSPKIDPIGFHGINERVSLESYQTALWFYEQLLTDLK